MTKPILSRRALIASGLSIFAMIAPSRAETRGNYRVGVYDLENYDISVHWKDEAGQAYRSLEALKRDLEQSGKHVLALANAGIYGKDDRPLGVHIENGKTLRKLNRGRGGGNFFLKPNGVFYLTRNRAGITRTESFRSKGVIHATQSGPLLFDKKGIHPRFIENSTFLNVRNVVGVRKDGAVVLAISRSPVTFWDVAAFMRDEMDCMAGLYLDGSISKMWFRGSASIGHFKPFVGMIAVTEKAASTAPTRT